MRASDMSHPFAGLYKSGHTTGVGESHKKRRFSGYGPDTQLDTGADYQQWIFSSFGSRRQAEKEYGKRGSNLTNCDHS
jgi:hypothetical protein